MLRFLQSIFGIAETREELSDATVRKAIERAVDGTDPWLRSLSGYRKRLRPSVVRAIEHVVSLVDSLPPAVPVSPAHYAEDSLLKAFFISQAEAHDFFRNDPGLNEFLRESGRGLERITALLFLEKKESMGFGSELSGDIVVRDVPQVTVWFESQRLIDPAGNENETRLKLKKRAFDYLVRVALQSITALKGERKELERQSALLQSKIDLLRRGGWSSDVPGPDSDEDMEVLKKRLEELESHLMGMGNGSILDSYLDMVADVLGRPEDYLCCGQESLILDSLGIKRQRPDVNTVELNIFTMTNAEGRCYVLQLVSIPVKEIRAQ